jgi:hypothetical protein
MSTVLVAVGSALRFLRNGSDKDKKRGDRWKIRLSTAEEAGRLAADRRRLENARSKVAKVEQDASANCLL